MIDINKVLPTAHAALDALVRIPSVSAEPTEDMRRSAELTAGLFRDAGMPEMEILDDRPGGQPAVLARYPAPPGQPTVLLYAHHDVQPAGELTQWSSQRFEPAERDGRLFGRGTADDKSGIAAHLAAVLAHEGNPPVGVTVLVEGEEETSSPTLGTLLTRHRDRLAADVIVLADSENLERGTPAFTTSLRGTAACIVELRTLETGVHSGSFGGPAPDALSALCRLLATLHDEHGNVAVAGLKSGPVPGYSYPVPRYRAEAGVLDGVELHGTGSIPFVAEFATAFPTAAILVTSAGADTDSNPHGANESVHLTEFERACHAEALLLCELSRD
jgi:cysteinylglycine-S-conjugate dipeptidase